jgi:F0F1-type ATP synthase assembly protein I
MSNKNNSEGTKYLYLIGKITGKVAFAIIASFFLGLTLERYIPLKGLLIVGCLLLGLGISFYQIYKEIISLT